MTPLRLLLLLQHLRRGRRRLPRRNCVAQSGDAVWRIQGSGRARYRTAGGRQFQPHLHEKCDRLRRISAPAAGYRSERPGGIGLYHRPRLHQERRHTMASHRPHSRHHRGRCWQCSKRRGRPIHNETFNVGRTEENYRISELADIVAETVPGCRVEYAPGGGPDKRCYRVSCDKIRRVLPSFRPQWTARKGAQELYEAYRAAGLSSRRSGTRPLCHGSARFRRLHESRATGCFSALDPASSRGQPSLPESIPH